MFQLGVDRGNIGQYLEKISRLVWVGTWRRAELVISVIHLKGDTHQMRQMTIATRHFELLGSRRDNYGAQTGPGTESI